MEWNALYAEYAIGIYRFQVRLRDFDDVRCSDRCLESILVKWFQLVSQWDDFIDFIENWFQ